MIDKLLAAMLSCTCLLGSGFAQAWTKDGDKIVFQREEISHCDDYAMDAGAIMLGRQLNEPPYYGTDEYRPPTAATYTLRDILSRQVLAYPVRDTEQERRKDLEDFVQKAKAMCVQAYMESKPAKSAP